ncbi:inactive leucine-rich repeat receptor-like serine/threonine-protein kinase At1g60630 [Ricinus communis]|uniref:Receptor-kinase, putative n=1 Tax=Ricinus communis TaxID=3988 RepID=B9RY46_RICCO|nr:inactive leucine-rich repeat receptor-like serine/threonine-protein kinase At1g60630 [Ricinus communis]XP_015574382.1 inactive leucine-rich repeat receptor-like serine/threonine-protein kinase At1g60630 [Ricinus communis]EEF43738.1 receptor-kinase, putative [Ricinus communis]|eukprot:XP_002518813.1 inactive leucine-rich repeat receptor-like serine/threonine-protein kinase At1g60630 [Ricinus communis]
MESRYHFLYLLLFCTIWIISPVTSSDAEALLTLKSSIDPSNSLPWPQGSDACKWRGIKECMNGRVTKLVLEYLNLRGTLDAKTLNQLDQLRVLSFKGNSISGQIPSLSGLVNLKSLFLNSNNFSGNFPDSITSLHRLKVVVLADNQISGPLPVSLLKLARLYVLNLQDNRFTGPIPPLNQTSLRFFNVSNNELSGEIPVTPALIRFNTSSFSGNVDICGEQIGNPCSNREFGPPASPAYPRDREGGSKSSSKRSKLIKIIVGTVGGFLVVCLLITICLIRMHRGRNRKEEPAGVGEVRSKAKGVAISSSGENGNGGGGGGNNSGTQGGFSWEGEGLGTLVFLGAGDQQMSYSLEDLLKASAETLGRGSMGSTYKAVMESGFIVTVKRLKDARYPRVEEFRRHMDLLGRLRHPNLVPLRAYFQAKEERLLVYDYFPNGSLFSLLHGTRTSGGGKPLHWTSCLKIAEDLATGLLYIHQNPGLTHGNLKSSNVLLGPEFESCLTDYGLTVFRDPDLVEEPSATSLFYRAPESRDMRKPSTQQADVYSFGVLLLELLTGKTPFQDLVQEHGSDIPRWVRSVREEETESGDDPTSGNEAAEEKLLALVNVAMACVSLTPESRPSMREVLKMIRDARAEAQVSSNSSDHSPGRWSDTVQSLPRDEHLSI